MLRMAIEAALEAGQRIMEVYASDFSVELKADRSPLTEADKAAHRAIARHLSGSGIPILSEEGSEIPFAERRGWQRLWLVDPLDGTKEFVHRNGEFTVNIALVDQGVPVMGVIYAPATDVLYANQPQGGAFRLLGAASMLQTERSIAKLLAAATPLPDVAAAERPFTVAGSRSHLSAETASFVAALKEEHRELRFLSVGSSLKFCLLAEGKADIYPRFAPTMEWDTAAGHAIAVAAGCGVRRHDGSGPLHYNKESLLNPWFVAQR